MANKEYVNLTGLTVYDEAIKDYISENTPVLVEIEQADYDELTPAQKMDENYYYYIKDASTVGADTIGQLSDVAITTPSNGDVLQYNETNANWENSPIPTANIDTIKVNGTALTPDANKAVDITVPTNTVSDNPTFSEAGTRTNIASGESFATILGKIKKFFTDLKTVAFTGSYSDLSDTPTINDGQLTIQQNGTNKATFTANQSANATANIITDEWTSTSTVQSDNTVTFSGLNDDYGYKLYCQDKYIGISDMTKTGSGTNVTFVFTVTGAAAGDICKLRILK